MAFHSLVCANRDHLLRFGNYADLTDSTLADIAADFTRTPDRSLRMGAWLSGDLAGRVDLNRVRPGVFVLGYWFGLAFTGRGYATESCRALLDHGREALDGQEIWAGVTHGNVKSVAVLKRLGFNAVEVLPDRTRFRLVV